MHFTYIIKHTICNKSRNHIHFFEKKFPKGGNMQFFSEKDLKNEIKRCIL